MPAAEPKVYAYARWSTPDQARGTSYERQLEAARVFAARTDMEVDDSFVDSGLSAWKGDNVRIGALGRFLRLCEDGAIADGSVLFIENQDRLSRSADIWDALDVFRRITKAGIGIHVQRTGETYSYESIRSDPYKLLVPIIDMMRSSEESRRKSELITDFWRIRRQQAREQGKIISSQAPAWLRIVNGERFEVVPEKVATVKRIFEVAAKGYSFTRLARDLNDEGVPTLSGRGLWRHYVIRKLVQNRAVLGEYVPHRWVRGEDGKSRRVRTDEDVILGYYPSIVEPELFSAAQLGPSQMGKHATSGTPLRNILARAGRCGTCGGSAGMLSRGKGMAGRQLVCRNSRLGGDHCPAGQPKVPILWVEEALIRAAPDMQQHGAGDDTLLRQIADMLGYEWQLADDIDMLLALAKGQSGLERTRERLHESEQELVQIRAERAELEREAAERSGPLVEHRLRVLVEALTADPIDREACNTAIRAAVDRVVFDWQGEQLVLHWRHGGTMAISWVPQLEIARRVFEKGRNG